MWIFFSYKINNEFFWQKFSLFRMRKSLTNFNIIYFQSRDTKHCQPTFWPAFYEWCFPRFRDQGRASCQGTGDNELLHVFCCGVVPLHMHVKGIRINHAVHLHRRLCWVVLYQALWWIELCLLEDLTLSVRFTSHEPEKSFIFNHNFQPRLSSSYCE